MTLFGSGETTLFGKPANGTPSVFGASANLFGQKPNANLGSNLRQEESEDEQSGEDAEAPIYASEGLQKVDQGAQVRASPYTKAFEVSGAALPGAEKNQRVQSDGPRAVRQGAHRRHPVAGVPRARREAALRALVSLRHKTPVHWRVAARQKQDQALGRARKSALAEDGTSDGRPPRGPQGTHLRRTKFRTIRGYGSLSESIREFTRSYESTKRDGWQKMSGACQL